MPEQRERLLYQIDERSKIVKSWRSVKDIVENFVPSNPDIHLNRSAFDQALRTGYKAHGYFWIFKHEWKQGRRPDLGKQVRNKKIYAYQVKNFDSKKEISKQKKNATFVGRFFNAVQASDILDLSVSNVRCVLRGQKKIHKGHYFSFEPLEKKDEKLADKMEKENKAPVYKRKKKGNRKAGDSYRNYYGGSSSNIDY